jgi:pyridoxine 5-phosphate synthase
MAKLSVNLNKIALLRNSRGHNFPDVVDFGRQALDFGVAGLTVHPRPDQRHARYDDLPLLSELIGTYPGREFNIEGYPSIEFLDRVCAVKPHQCTLVPDSPDQLTSDHGWDTRQPQTLKFLEPVIRRLKDAGIRVSLFIDPDPTLATAARDSGTDRVELYTEQYAERYQSPTRDDVLTQYRLTAEAAREAGLGVNAGHDLNLDNLGLLVKSIPWIDEVSIGHALVVEALEIGWHGTIDRYLEILAFAAPAA